MRNHLNCAIIVCGFILLFSAQGSRAQLPQQRFRWVSPPVETPQLQQRIFYSQIAQTRISYHIFLPDAYDRHPEQRFPVIYWLHGSGPRPTSGIPYIVKWFRDAMQDGHIPPALIVFPYGPRSMWCDSKDGRIPIESVLIHELIPDVDATFRTRPQRGSRLIEGFSMGGYGALRLGFKYPHLFGAISSLSGGPLQPVFTFSVRASDRMRRQVLQRIYGGDMAYFKAQSPWRLAEQNADAIRGRIHIRLVIGDQDAMIFVTRQFVAHLQELGIPHRFIVLPDVGHHPMAVLKALGSQNWEFYRQVFSSGNDAQKSDSGR